MSAYPMKPQVSREPNGNINVFVGGAYQCIPHEKALVLLEQLAEALCIPFNVQVAQFAAGVLQAHRGDYPDDVSDVDGGTVQELALDCELIEPFICPPDLCGESCMCSAGDDCYRLSPVGRALVTYYAEVRP